MNDPWSIAWFGLMTLGVSAFVTGVLRRYAAERILDIPNERSSHVRPTPRGGGVGFLVAFFACALLTSLQRGAPDRDHTVVALLALMLPLAIVSFIDDKRGLPRSFRYGVHLAVATATVWYFGPARFPWLLAGVSGFVISVIAVTALINFYNFMDGIDGLVAGVSLVQFAWIAVWLDEPLWTLLAAALLGFLVWNWSPAKIFMGDIGSTVLGALVGAALLWHQEGPGFAWSNLVVFMPLVGDAVYTLTRRALRRENIFMAHRSHVYQRLTRTGWSHARTSAVYMALTAALGGLAYAFGATGALVGAVGLLVLLVAAEGYLTRRREPFAIT